MSSMSSMCVMSSMISRSNFHIFWNFMYSAFEWHLNFGSRSSNLEDHRGMIRTPPPPHRMWLARLQWGAGEHLGILCRYNEEMQIFIFSILSSCKIAVAICTSLLACGRQQQTANWCPDSPAETAGLKNIPQWNIEKKTQESSLSS